jgi:hypothetical protein
MQLYHAKYSDIYTVCASVPQLLNTFIPVEESGAIIYPRSDAVYNVSAEVEVKLNNLVRDHNERMTHLTSGFADEVEPWIASVNKAEQQIKYERMKAKRRRI